MQYSIMMGRLLSVSQTEHASPPGGILKQHNDMSTTLYMQSLLTGCNMKKNHFCSDICDISKLDE